MRKFAGLLLLLPAVLCSLFTNDNQRGHDTLLMGPTVHIDPSIPSFDSPEIDAWVASLQRNANNTRIRKHLLALTNYTHLAGTPGQLASANYVHAEFQKYGLNSRIDAFDALMNFPVKDSTVVEVVSPEPYTCVMQEPVVDGDPTSGRSDIPSFVGYAATGDVTGVLVYANYGNIDDYRMLDAMNISLRGRIVIVRYGVNFRGTKVQLAEQRGAAAVLVYSDPKDDGIDRGAVYPDGPWRPEESVQRGSCQYLMTCPGDPRRVLECLGDSNANPAGQLYPNIPVQPLSASDAKHLLRQLQGAESPDSWKGSIPGVSYNIGPGPASVRVAMRQTLTPRPLYNVIAELPGTDHASGEFIMVGNHRDAWVFGAVDPSSGTAVMLELARVLALLSQQGFTPRKTIRFGSWDGEEYGLIGSVYHGEHMSKTETKGMIAYFNVDAVVSGPNFSVAASSSLISLITWATRKVVDPNTGGPIYNVWNRNVGVLGSGSDYTVFLHHLGVPSVDIGFGGPYGVYHSNYDSFTWMEKFGDPNGFVYHGAATQLLGVMMIATAGLSVTPLAVVDVSTALQSYFEQVRTLANGTVRLADLQSAVVNFNIAAVTFNKQVVEARQSGRDLDHVNNVLKLFERKFLHAEGLPKRLWYKHVLQAPGVYLGYGSDVFPGLSQAIRDGNQTLASEQVSVISACINAAGDFLAWEDDDELYSNIIMIAAIVGGVAVISIGVCLCYKPRQCCGCCRSEIRQPLLGGVRSATPGKFGRVKPSPKPRPGSSDPYAYQQQSAVPPRGRDYSTGATFSHSDSSSMREPAKYSDSGRQADPALAPAPATFRF